MPIAVGTKLGPYELLALAGAGGMGEVYRARDTRLDREVAIKVLPEHLSSSGKFRERFEREARAISSLKHPNICTLYDVGHQDGTDYLVLEYLEGESLAERLQRGPLPMAQVLAYGIQIADALERAHRQGVVHRDLKPGNVMVTKDGVKLLDFGLAKPMAGAGLASSALGAMTASQHHKPLTAEGTIVGTFQYMAPEQLEGKDADPRSDLFGFGCVLYEMAAGKRPFDGKTQASVVASILATEPPPISSVQPLTPPAFERLVKTCLAKDPEERWQTAHDVKLQLKAIAEGGSQAGLPAPVIAARKMRDRVAWLIASVLLLVVIGGGAAWWFNARQAAPTMYFFSSVPFSANDVALSPDGHKVALVAYSDQMNKYIIWVHEIGSRSAAGIAGTEDASHPFWSPDGRYIGFFAQGKLKKVDLSSANSVQVLCDAPHGRGGAWNRDGVIVFTPDVWMGLQRVSAGGGTPVEITKPDSSHMEMSNRWPVFLPDGRHFIYLAANFAGEFRKNALYVGSLDSNEKRLITLASSNAAYVAPGYLLYLRDTTLMAQKFDLRTFSLSGEPQTLSSDVQYFPQIDLALFSVAGDGTLVMQTGKGAAKGQLAWIDRNGKQVGVVGTEGVFADPAISPDGRSVAFDQMEPDGRNDDVWIREVRNDAVMRLTFGPGLMELPAWSPDGKRIAFMANQGLSSGLHLKNADGSGSDSEIAQAFGSQQYDWGWSPDGKYLLLARGNALAYISLGDKQPKMLIQGNGIVRNAQFSPDGKWIAYSSNETGAWEIYVSPFPDAGSKWQVSRGGGVEPRWRHDGKELFYLSSEGKMMAAPVKLGATFESGSPLALFQSRVRQPISSGDVVSYDVTADGQKFLINTRVDEPNAAPLSVILNWSSEMEK